jgi:hypothetical protein
VTVIAAPHVSPDIPAEPIGKEDVDTQGARPRTGKRKPAQIGPWRLVPISFNLHTPRWSSSFVNTRVGSAESTHRSRNSFAERSISRSPRVTPARRVKAAPHLEHGAVGSRAASASARHDPGRDLRMMERLAAIVVGSTSNSSCRKYLA